MHLVTGGTGHIGNVVVRKLIERGEKVRVLVLKDSNIDALKDLDVEICYGDIMSPSDLDKATLGIKNVYHLAAIISTVSYDVPEVTRINFNGTRNVVKACLKNKIDRLVYISSFHALRRTPEGEEVQESIGFDPDARQGVYDRSKARASIAVLDAVKNDGLDAVIVCPTGVLGPYDFLPSDFGKFIKDYIKGKQKVILNGGFNFADVRDVAEGIVAAGEKGRKGETYILGGNWMTMQELNGILEEFTGIPRPKLIFPLPIAFALGWILENISRFTHKNPMLSVYTLRTLQENPIVTSAKAKNELGYAIRDTKQSLIDHTKWIKNNFN